MKHQLLQNIYLQVLKNYKMIIDLINKFLLGYETSAFPKYLSQVQSSSTQVLQNNNRFDIFFCKVMKHQLSQGH